MIFDLEKQEQGDWFDFFNSTVDPTTGEVSYSLPEKDAARFRIRSTVPFWEERRKGRKKRHEMVLNPSTRAMERVSFYDTPEADEEQDNQAAWDYSITGIENAFDASKNAIEATLENKMKLIKIPAFLRFIMRVFEIISDSGVQQAEAQEKN